MITQERLKELLNYDPETGVFTWLVSRKGVNVGQPAGAIGFGYRRIRIDGKLYKASRLAWLWMEGYMPEHDVDHRNRIRDDDRWCNLRHASRMCNMRNSSIRIDNTSNITGVSFCKERQKWAAYIVILSKRIFLGRFKSKLDAAHARWEAEVKHDFPNCNTTSTAFQYLQLNNS